MLGGMYDVALSVSACLRAGTRVDVAWVVASDTFAFDPGVDAVALTPGGGRIGRLLAGAFDGPLAEVVQRELTRGRLVDLTASDVEATVAGLPRGGSARCALVPAAMLPERLWPLLLERKPLCLVCTIEGDEVVGASVHSADGVADAGDEVATLFAGGASAVATFGNALVTVLHPVPRLVVFGGGPIAAALAAGARLLDWQVSVEADVQTAIGLMAGLSPLDGAVIMGHDVEPSSRVLAAALESPAGYIGSIGSLEMQRNRADWLAYRGIDDLSRVHGPAGIDIGASTPGEIAISILAEAIATRAEAG
jgi:xanthine dehydrogenase accessory factor